jgi:Tfp pilus assembly PilM family ATPase
MINKKTSLGINISESEISFAMLSHAKKQARLIKAGSALIPEGVIKAGNIADPVELGKCLKKLLNSNGLRKCNASVSLLANPSLIQIIDMPAEMPGNIAQFVKSEIKFSTAIAGKQHQYDYHGLGDIGINGTSRVMVTAVDDKKLSALLSALATAGIEPVSIEPAMIAWMRALYDRHMTTNYDGNVLMARADTTSVTVCVLRKGVLDFIRNTEMPMAVGKKEYLEFFRNELDSVKKFYDIDIAPFEDNKWQMVVEIDPVIAAVDEISELYASEFAHVDVCLPQQVDLHTSVRMGKSIGKTSIVAVGLALGQNEEAKMKINLDLVPESVRKVKTVKKLTFSAAVAAIVVITVTLLCSNLMSAQFSKTDKKIEITRQLLATAEVVEVLTEKKQIDRQKADIESRRDFMVGVLTRNKHFNWSEILDTIVEKSTENICITNLSQIRDEKVVITGKVPSHKHAHAFAVALADSDYFKSAVVSEIKKDPYYNGLIDYTMDCVLNTDWSEK